MNKVNSLSNAAVLADKFILTHCPIRPERTSYPVVKVAREETLVSPQTWRPGKSVKPPRQFTLGWTTGNRVCLFCLDPGHLIADCKAWKQKAAAKTKNVAFARSVSESDFTYGPFILHGTVTCKWFGK